MSTPPTEVSTLLAAFDEADLLWLHRFAARHGLPQQTLYVRQSVPRLLAWIVVCGALTALFGFNTIGPEGPDLWVMLVLTLVCAFFTTGFLLRLRRRHSIELSVEGWREHGHLHRWEDLTRLGSDSRDRLELQFGETRLRPDLALMPLSTHQLSLLATLFIDTAKRGVPADFATLLPANKLPVPPRWHDGRAWLGRKLGRAVQFAFGLCALFVWGLQRNFPDDPALLPNSHWVKQVVVWSWGISILCLLLGPLLVWLIKRLEPVEEALPWLTKSLAALGLLIGGVLVPTSIVFFASLAGWFGLEIWRFSGG